MPRLKGRMESTLTENADTHPMAGADAMDAPGIAVDFDAPAWTDASLQNPHAVADKAQRVRTMFAAIAPTYDLNNRVHSLGLDQHWRRVAVKMATVLPSDVVADIACGTGDLTLAFARAEPRQVVGIDFCHPMLQAARQKLTADVATFYEGDATRLPLADASVDVVSIAFGIRNVADVAAAMAEFARVLRPEGRLIILEFSLPGNPILRGMYNLYFKHVMPRSATLISGDRTGAYKYLPRSVNTFIDRDTMRAAMEAVGFRDVVAKPLSAGICVCYRGVRRGG